MKMGFFTTLLLLLITGFIQAQESILQGVVYDQSGSALSYVNIGIIGSGTGTVSDANGMFRLYLSDAKIVANDTLRFSSIGYKTKDFRINSILDSDTLKVQLELEIFALTEIVVRPNNLKSFTEGKKKTSTKRNVNFSISSKKNQNLGSEIGKRFKLSSRKESFLQSFRFYVRANDFERVKFRVNIYKLKKKHPGKRINQENIIVELSNQQTGWIGVDLSPYDLAVKGDVIVGVEWIEHSPKGRRLALPIVWPSFGSKHYYKYGSQSKWKKFNNLSTAMMLEYEQ